MAFLLKESISNELNLSTPLFISSLNNNSSQLASMVLWRTFGSFFIVQIRLLKMFFTLRKQKMFF